MKVIEIPSIYKIPREVSKAYEKMGIKLKQKNINKSKGDNDE